MSVKNVADMTEQSEWIDRADEFLADALENIRSDDVIDDAIQAVTEALIALYLSVGETPATVVLDAAGYRDREEDECSCPPELVARGGWRSRCPVHGVR
jgi:hypothetical protein